MGDAGRTVSYTHAKVFTGTGESDFAEAFRVADGRFTWVGPARDLDDPDPVDLGGATVLPGLLDVHQHPSMLAGLVDSVDLLPPTVASVAELVAALSTHPALGKGSDAWIEGFGYNEARYPEGTPTCRDLDRVSTGQPVFCLRADVHTAVCNSVLLERAGITRETPDPPGARFGRFSDGSPNGVLEEFGAIDLVTRLRPVANAEEWVRRIVALNRHYGRLGVTTVDDLLATHLPHALPIFRRAAAAGYAPRTGLFWQWDPINGLPELTDDDRTGQIRVAGVKLLLDGAYSNRTAWTLDPYPGTTDHGLSTVSTQELIRGVEWARRNGVQAALHAMGDRAITLVIDTFADWEPWLGDKPSIRIEHCTLVSPQMIDRVASARMRFGLISHTIFFFAEYDDYARNLTPRQFQIAYPIRSLYERVPFTALASDAPATAWADADNPFVSVQAAVLRRAYNGADLGQAEAIRVGQALELYTHLAAACTTATGVGTIEPGHDADFIVLDADVFTIHPERIGQVRVLQTWVRGQRVWPPDVPIAPSDPGP